RWQPPHEAGDLSKRDLRRDRLDAGRQDSHFWRAGRRQDADIVGPARRRPCPAAEHGERELPQPAGVARWALDRLLQAHDRAESREGKPVKRRNVLTGGLSVAAAMSLGRAGAAGAADSPARADCWSAGALAARGRTPGATAGVRTGGCRMVRLHNGYNVWVKHVAAYNSSIPVLTLHGGPGFPHFYFECF